MQHKQFNFVRTGTKPAVVTLLLLLAPPVWAGTIVKASKPDPLLDSGPTVPCAAGVDYAPGHDTAGNPVIPADIAGRPVPLPDAVSIPMGGNRAPLRGRRQAYPQALGSGETYVTLDGKKLEPLLNPPACPTHP